MSVLWIICFVAISTATAAAASVRIATAQDAQAYLDMIFAQHDCRLSFAHIDQRMRRDGIIPTEAEMHSDIGVAKFIHQRRVMQALDRLFQSGEVSSDPDDQNIAISRFGGCA